MKPFIIMLVEDDPTTLSLLKLIIARIPSYAEFPLVEFELVAIGNSNEALRRVSDGSLRPNLVITDLMMPGLSGIELLNAIRQLLGADAIHSIIVSAAGQNASVMDAITAASDCFVPKPVSAKAMCAAITSVCPEIRLVTT